MLIDGDFFESLADVSFGDMYQNFKPINKNHLLLDKDLIYVFINSERLVQLINVCSTIDKDFIIISHNSDITIDVDIKLPNNIKHIFMQNYNGISNNITPLPIGLERKRWFPEERKQEKLINIDKNVDKNIDIYMNFNPNTNSIRKKWSEYFSSISYVENLGNGSSFDNYVNKLLSSEYVLSPPGNGIDCHRNWECLYLGITPIIQRSNFTEYIYGDMGVILVDDITEVTLENIENYRTNSDAYHIKMSTDYWEKLIKSYEVK